MIVTVLIKALVARMSVDTKGIVRGPVEKAGHGRSRGSVRSSKGELRATKAGEEWVGILEQSGRSRSSNADTMMLSKGGWSAVKMHGRDAGRIEETLDRTWAHSSKMGGHGIVEVAGIVDTKLTKCTSMT
jgi:hypothetical protein